MLMGRRRPRRDGAETERAGARTHCHRAAAYRGCPARRRARATTASCFPGARRCAGPRSQVLRLRRAAAADRDGGLNQAPAGARVAGLGDRAPRAASRPSCTRRAPSRGRPRADARGGSVGHRRWRRRKAAAVTGPMLGTERRRGTRGSWTARCSIVASEYVSCPLRGRMRARSGATTERKRPGRRRLCTRGTKCSALPEGTR